MTSAQAARIRRHPERSVRERAELDAILDACPVGTLSTTAADGAPLVVPLLQARDGDRILLHGSSGAGALRRAAAGAPVVLSVAMLDGLVFDVSLFDSSANYRSAVVPGVATALHGDAAADALRALGEQLMPGRAAEVRGTTGKEYAATLVLELPIGQAWTAKRRAGGPAPSDRPSGQSGQWTGVLPVRQVWDAPQGTPGCPLPVPPSVLRLRQRLNGYSASNL